MKALLISAAFVGAALSTTAFAQSISTPINAASGSAAQAAQDDSVAQGPLTRRDVYNQLVRAEKDGTMTRMDSIYYGTYWGQDVGGRPTAENAG